MVAHLHARSSYSLLSSTLSIQQLVQRSKELGFSAVALTDYRVMMGTMEFYKVCEQEGVKPIFGLELDCLVKGNEAPFLLIAKNDQGFKNLLLCASAASNGKVFTLIELQEYIEGNIIIAYGEGGVFESSLINENERECIEFLEELKGLGEYYLALSMNETSFWKIRNQWMKSIAKKIGIETIAINKIYYKNKDDEELFKIINGIKSSKTLESHSLPTIKGRYILGKEELKEIYDEDDLSKTEWIVSQCNVNPMNSISYLPKFKTPDNIDGSNYLKQLCIAGLKKRFEGNMVSSAYAERLKYELEVIISMKFEDYFLIVWDFIRYARKKNIYVGPGRGSAASSLVAYCLGITHVDPLKYNLLFERFLNPERISMPDIDIDFPDNRRDEVIQYVYDTYGKEHIAHIITFGTLRAKQVLRDVGRVLEIPLHQINTLSKAIPVDPKITLKKAYTSSSYFRQLVDSDKKIQRLFSIAQKLEGLPRHASTHAAGIVMSSLPLSSVVPTIQIEQEMVSTQYTMEYLEELGLIKMDFLGLRNLTIIDAIVNEINQIEKDFNIYKIDLDNKKTFQLLRQVDTVGIFQLESDGMKNLLRQMQVTSFNDIVATIALFRPGPMENIPMYLEARRNSEKISYLHPSLIPILKETYGVMIYQEQIMQVTQVMAGFSLAKSDLLRKAMSKKKAKDLQNMEKDFVDGCKRNGHSDDLTKKMFDLILKFAGYGFNKAHSVSYGLISYQLAYLKANYPNPFYCALLNSVIGSESKTAEYIDECRRHGVLILPPSINESNYRYELKGSEIRFPLLAIKNIGQAAIEEILAERELGKFAGFYDFVARIMTRKVNRKMIESLIDAGALDEFKINRKSLHCSLDEAIRYSDLVRIETEDQIRIDLGLVSKPILVSAKEDPQERSEKEKKVLGFYLDSHPILHVKKNRGINVDPLVVLQKRKGIVQGFCSVQRVKQHRTKKGDLMAFVVGVDETGELDLVFMPRIYQKEAEHLSKGKYLFFSGKIDDKGSCLINSVQYLGNGEKE